MEESPYANETITVEFVRDVIYERVREDRTRAYATYLKDSVATPTNYRDLALRFIGEVFDAGAYWFHFLYENRPEDKFVVLLDHFIENADQLGREITENWLPEHRPNEFHSALKTYLHSRKLHWIAEVMKRTRETNSRDRATARIKPATVDYSAAITEGESAAGSPPLLATWPKPENPTGPPQPKEKLIEFPQRAVWLLERLRERSWRKNHLRQYGGPDRKTAQKILNGFPVTEEVLEKILVALNKKKIGKTLTVLDIPTD